MTQSANRRWISSFGLPALLMAALLGVAGCGGGGEGDEDSSMTAGQLRKKLAAEAADNAEAESPRPPATSRKPAQPKTAAVRDGEPAVLVLEPASRYDALIAGLTIFVLAIFVGFEVIAKVPPTLHTPLMSGSNAISGITLVGAVIVAAKGLGVAPFVGLLAVILATINAVGGFLVTHRMLAMFKKR